LIAIHGCEDPQPASQTEETPDTVSTPEDIQSLDTTTPDVATPLPDNLSVCEPDCEDRDCGTDGCGGNCGVCEENFKCDDNGQCVDVCLPQQDTICIGQAVYWVDGCGETGEIKENCSTGTQCTQGSCIPCTPNVTIDCLENARTQFDDCGNPGEVVEECPEDTVCFEGVCVLDDSPYSGVYSLTVEPAQSQETLEGVPVQTSFPATEMVLDVHPDGTVELEFTAPDMSWTGLGTMEDNKLTAGCEFEEMQGDNTLIHKSAITALFTNDNELSGTINDLVFLNNEEGIPTSVLRELTASKPPALP